jgi:hypothetical protein
MSQLLPDENRKDLSNLGDQNEVKDPIVCAVFHFSLSGWSWYATEADVSDDDVCFFGYVVGLECEWGYFCLSELESVDINGITVCRDRDHVPRPLSECLEQCGLDEN